MCALRHAYIIHAAAVVMHGVSADQTPNSLVAQAVREVSAGCICVCLDRCVCAAVLPC